MKQQKKNDPLVISLLVGVCIGCLVTSQLQQTLTIAPPRTVEVNQPPPPPPLTVPDARTTNSVTDNDRSLATTSTTLSKNATTTQRRTLHVLFGMFGIDVLTEFEMALKSVLLNAPLDFSLEIHLLLSRSAYAHLPRRIWRSYKLQKTQWRNPITITYYQISRQLNEHWIGFVSGKIRGLTMDHRVTIGGYYRLLAYQILPERIKSYVFMDADALVTANLNELAYHVDNVMSENAHSEELLFLLSDIQPCTGFMVIFTKHFQKFWDYVDRLPDFDNGGDQKLTTMVMEHFNSTFLPIPRQWDIHLGNGWFWKPQSTLSVAKKMAMLHFNGARDPYNATYWNQEGGFDFFCQRSPRCHKFRENFKVVGATWGLADYYVRIAWSQVVYYGEAMAVPGSSHELQIRDVLCNCTTSAMTECKAVR